MFIFGLVPMFVLSGILGITNDDYSNYIIIAL